MYCIYNNFKLEAYTNCIELKKGVVNKARQLGIFIVLEIHLQQQSSSYDATF